MTLGVALKLLAGRGVSATADDVIEVLSSGGPIEADYSDAKIRVRGRGRARGSPEQGRARGSPEQARGYDMCTIGPDGHEPCDEFVDVPATSHATGSEEDGQDTMAKISQKERSEMSAEERLADNRARRERQKKATAKRNTEEWNLRHPTVEVNSEEWNLRFPVGGQWQLQRRGSGSCSGGQGWPRDDACEGWQLAACNWLGSYSDSGLGQPRCYEAVAKFDAAEWGQGQGDEYISLSIGEAVIAYPDRGLQGWALGMTALERKLGWYPATYAKAID